MPEYVIFPFALIEPIFKAYDKSEYANIPAIPPTWLHAVTEPALITFLISLLPPLRLSNSIEVSPIIPPAPRAPIVAALKSALYVKFVLLVLLSITFLVVVPCHKA